MTSALNLIYSIFDRFVDFVFNSMEILSGVTVGWITVAVILFSMMIKSILNLPRSMGNFDKFRAHTYVTNTTHSDGSKSWTQRQVFRR